MSPCAGVAVLTSEFTSLGDTTSVTSVSNLRPEALLKNPDCRVALVTMQPSSV